MQTIIAGLPAYIIQIGTIEPGKVYETDIWLPGMGETIYGAKLKGKGPEAVLLYGEPKFRGSTEWQGPRIIVAVQYPNYKFNGELISKIVAEVKALPGVDTARLSACGLSLGAIFWLQWMCAAIANARAFKACCLMSGKFPSGYLTKAAYFLHMHMELRHGTLDKVVLPNTYREAYKTYKAAGVDIHYVEQAAAHTNTVWNWFDPAKKEDGTSVYSRMGGSPAAPQPAPLPAPVEAPTPQPQEPQKNKVMPEVMYFPTTDFVIDGTQKDISTADLAAPEVKVELKPMAQSGVLVETLRVLPKQKLIFSDSIYHSAANESKRFSTLSTAGCYKLFWDLPTGKFFVVQLGKAA